MGSLRGRLKALVVAFAGVFLVIAVAAGWSVWRIDDTQDRLVGRVGVGRVAAKDLEVALLDQETAIRGFALTADEAFLDPGVVALAAETTAAERIRDTLSSRPEVIEALDRVEAAGQAWREEVAVPAAALAGGGDASEAVALLEDGDESFSIVRNELAALEEALLDQRDAAVPDIDRATDLLTGLAIATGLVLLAGGVLVILALRRSVLGPLDRLGADARAVTAGDFEHPIEPVGPTEIRELAEMVELMRTRITLELDEVRRAREDFAEKADELARSNRDLEQFAYVASHDLQEPLRKVSGFCQLLQRRYGGTLDERADEYIHHAVDGAERMQALISDLLSFSRVGRTTERFVPVDLWEVVDEAWSAIERPEGARVEVEGARPEIVGDRGLLVALFTNLFANSVKFAGDAVPVVRVSAREVGEVWHLAVADNGIGIAPEFADRIFVIFQRLHTREAYEGTGIGLALGKRIVEFHGGSVSLGESEVGACFEITFPVIGHRDARGPVPDTPNPHGPEGILS